jgi:hypothetical protein
VSIPNRLISCPEDFAAFLPHVTAYTTESQRGEDYLLVISWLSFRAVFSRRDNISGHREKDEGQHGRIFQYHTDAATTTIPMASPPDDAVRFIKSICNDLCSLFASTVLAD